MAHSIRNQLLTALATLVLASLTVAPPAAAQQRAGGRGQGGGGSGASQQRTPSGGAQQRAQVNNSNQDARSTQVRNSSVNNVNNVNRNTNVNNVNRNVNVNVNGNGGGWDNDYHPVATAAAVAGTAALIGSLVHQPPAGCVPINYGGVVYQQCGSTWYMPQGSQYAVVAPPY